MEDYFQTIKKVFVKEGIVSHTSFFRSIDVMEALEGENIESRPVWKPMHMQMFFAENDYIGGDVSEKLFKMVITE